MEAGNVKTMRDALLNIQEYAAAMDVDDGNVLAILDACRDALALPARNCDVGTAEEQAERLVEFCNSTDCGRCPHNRVGMDFRGCTLAWAQMPYEAQEGGAK